MSGLCGWWGRDDGQAALARMAAPLSRFDQAPAQLMSAAGCAVAVAQADSACHTYQHDGLLVALWGHPRVEGCNDGFKVTDGQALAQRLALLWRARGAQACQALSGPFALAILDSTAGEALLAVDRAGSLPLHYLRQGQALYFASSLDACDALPAQPQRGVIEPQALYSYLFFHMVPAPATIYRGWQRLLPGQYLHWRNNGVCIGSYWTLRFQEDPDDDPPASFASQQQNLLRLLRQAVERSLGSDPGRCGTFLSGGTDSTSIAAMVREASGQPARSYSIGFDAPGYDEMAYARQAARHVGSVHHEYYVTADDVLAAIPAIAAACDQPFGNASAVAAYYCARMASDDGVTRMLGGDGGDELFGGNARYAHQALLSLYERMPALLRQGCIEPLLFRRSLGLGFAGPWRLFDKARRYIELAATPMPKRLESHNLLLHYGPGTVLEPAFLDSIDVDGALGSLSGAWWQRPEKQLSQINAMLALDMRFTLADNDLPKVRLACELAGVEAAFPMLDDDLMAFAASLSPRDKLHGRQLRPFFKRALAGVLPGAIVRKQKHGFSLPFGLWLTRHAALRTFAFDSLSALRQRRIVRADFIDALQGPLLHEHPAYHGTMVWILLMLEQWLQAHPAALVAPMAATAGMLDVSGAGFATTATGSPARQDATV